MKVEEFMQKAGQEVPTNVKIPSKEVRLLRAKLLLEETLETLKALGCQLLINTNKQGFSDEVAELSDSNSLIVCTQLGSVTDVIDGCCDVRVIATGTLSSYGIDDIEVQEAVDDSNLAKFGEGGYRREDGKWMKPKNWKAPDFSSIITKGS